MAVNQEPIADMVVMLVKSALAPIQERLAAAEARLAVLGDVRDRVVTMEAKAAMPSRPSGEAVPDDEIERLVSDVFRKELGIPA